MDFLRRFWIYQGERFPLFAHGVLVAVISLAGVNMSAAARQDTGSASVGAWLVAFIVALGFFFQLRVADEFKDYVDDSAYRPYRPVPRGVIRLGELALLAIVVIAVQAVMTAWRSPRLLPLLLLVWGYLALMRIEFFVPAWLKAHPLLYLASHMAIMPLIFLFISACDWLAAGAMPRPGLGGFLALGYANGAVFEVGRKIRAPQDEEPGVETYSVLWGRRRAVAAWLVAVVLTALCAWLAGHQVINPSWLAAILLILACGAFAIGIGFLQSSTTASAKAIETYTSALTLLIFAVLGLAPIVMNILITVQTQTAAAGA